MKHHIPKTAKINLGLNHYVLNSSCPYKTSHSEYYKTCWFCFIHVDPKHSG